MDRKINCFFFYLIFIYNRMVMTDLVIYYKLGVKKHKKYKNDNITGIYNV